MPASKLRRLFVGSETTWGTPVAPIYLVTPVTAMAVRIANEYYQSDELGNVAPSLNTAQVAHSGGMMFDLDGSYQSIMVPLGGLDTAGSTGVGPYVHTYTLPTSAAGVWVPYTFLLDHADGTTEWKSEGSIAQGITIQSEQRGIWKISQEYLAQAITRTNGTAVPSTPVVELIRHADTLYYVDAVGGTMGATELTLTVRSWNLSVTNGRHLKWLGSGLAPSDYGVGGWVGTLGMRVEANTAALGYVEAGLLAKAERQIRIKATSGTAVAQIDFSGFLQMAPQELYQDDDGNVVMDLVWQGQDNVALGTWLKFAVTNGLAANPAG